VHKVLKSFSLAALARSHFVHSCLILIMLTACSRSSENNVSENQQEVPPPIAITGGFTLSGQVTFEGKVPPPTVIKMGGNPECSIHNKGRTYARDMLVQDGHVQNVFIYIKEGLEETNFPTPTDPVVIDQVGCRYQPRVVGAQVNQPILLRNSDPTLHNIHAKPKINKGWNVGLPVQGSKLTKKFGKPEIMVSLKCDLHSWMQGWIGVLPHPYFSLTGSSGRFEMENVPPGTYLIEAWHERFGTLTQTVEVKEGLPVAISFTYAG